MMVHTAAEDNGIAPTVVLLHEFGHEWQKTHFGVENYPAAREVCRKKPMHPHKRATLQAVLTLPTQYQGTASTRQLSGRSENASSCFAAILSGSPVGLPCLQPLQVSSTETPAIHPAIRP
jgi:hypothetical protein